MRALWRRQSAGARSRGGSELCERSRGQRPLKRAAVVPHPPPPQGVYCGGGLNQPRLSRMEPEREIRWLSESAFQGTLGQVNPASEAKKGSMAELTVLIRVSVGGALRHRFSSFSGRYGRGHHLKGAALPVLPLMNVSGARPPPRVHCRASPCSRCRVGAETWSASPFWRPLCGTPALP